MNAPALLVLGAGGHGRVVAELAEATGRFREVAFLDDRYPGLSTSGGWSVVGTFGQAPELRGRFQAAVVAIGDAQGRLSWLEKLERAGFKRPALIHPRAWVSPSAVLGAGVVVMAQAAVQTGAKLGEGCIVNTGATVDHDCELSAGVHICPGAHLGGDGKVGARSWIGIGSAVIHGGIVGADVTVGAGAAVVREVPSGQTVVGVPARPLRGSA